MVLYNNDIWQQVFHREHFWSGFSGLWTRALLFIFYLLLVLLGDVSSISGCLRATDNYWHWGEFNLKSVCLSGQFTVNTSDILCAPSSEVYTLLFFLFHFRVILRTKISVYLKKANMHKNKTNYTHKPPDDIAEQVSASSCQLTFYLLSDRKYI